jgi:Protein of unknown function (DUF3303)
LGLEEDERNMLFLITYRHSLATTLRVSFERFKESDALPPAGLTTVARWQMLDASGGVTVCETSNPVPLAKWASEWVDVLTTA